MLGIVRYHTINCNYVFLSFLLFLSLLLTIITRLSVLTFCVSMSILCWHLSGLRLYKPCGHFFSLWYDTVCNLVFDCNSLCCTRYEHVCRLNILIECCINFFFSNEWFWRLELCVSEWMLSKPGSPNSACLRLWHSVSACVWAVLSARQVEMFWSSQETHKLLKTPFLPWSV